MTDHKVSPEWLVATRVDFEYDEALKGGWGVSPAPLQRGASFTDFGTHEMAVPLGDSPADKAVRLHELIHARISPTQVPLELMSQLGVSSTAVRLAEEVRVNFVGRDVSVMVNRVNKAGKIELSNTLGDTYDLCDGTEKEVARKAVQNDSWNDALHIFLSTVNTEVHKSVKRTLRKNKEWREPLQVIEQSLDNRHRFIHYGHPWAGASTRSRFYVNNTVPVNYVWTDSKGNKQSTIIPQGFIHHTLALANDIDEWISNPPQRVNRRGRLSPEQVEANANYEAWETLSFGLTSLTETTSAFLGRRKRPAMTGKYPTRPDRLLTDPERRIFRETVRAKGGIVVFDCSGSMNVSHDVVAHAVKQFAGATVVVYSHSRGSLANAWVVARNGRMVSREEFDNLPLNQGNGVDGPVLRWAVRQRKHKEFIMWVSDGQVTGKGDNQTEQMKVECAHLSIRHNIIGVNDCNEALQLLSDLKKGMPLPRQKFCRLISFYVNEAKKYGTKTQGNNNEN